MQGFRAPFASPGSGPLHHLKLMRQQASRPSEQRVPGFRRGKRAVGLETGGDHTKDSGAGYIPEIGSAVEGGLMAVVS
jgi:hypothetical protein